jgi:hypothetical protein
VTPVPDGRPDYLASQATSILNLLADGAFLRADEQRTRSFLRPRSGVCGPLPRLQLSDDRGTRYEMHAAAVGGTGTENLAELHYVPTVPPEVGLLTIEIGA